MKNSKKTSRPGFSLLELIVTTAMLAALTASCMVIVRTSYATWNRHEDDHAQRRAELAVLKHIVRQVRQARAVMAISPANDVSGNLSLLDANGNVLVWEHTGATKQVLFGITTATEVLATGIEELVFMGMEANGTTPTTVVGDIHLVECTTKVNLIRPSGTGEFEDSNRAWLRSW